MTGEHARVVQAGAFEHAAGEYERGRPLYPGEAVDWLVPAGVGRILDLGAGTGKLTRELSRRGLDVLAVEPSGAMRRELTRVLPQVPALAGSAEQIPLDDDSVDVVLVAQAWHWVDPGQAVPEVARVLSAGGRLGLLWNVRDERHDWVARLGQILAAHTEPDMNTNGPLVGPPFAEVERFEVEWTHYLAPIALMDLVASRSYVITLGPQERNRVLGQVRDLLHTHPDLVGRDQFALPYLTRCHRADLLG